MSTIHRASRAFASLALVVLVAPLAACELLYDIVDDPFAGGPGSTSSTFGDDVEAPTGHVGGELVENEMLRDPSFEENPSTWSLTHDQFALDDTTAYHGDVSLRVELDAGVGWENTAFSREISSLEDGREYRLRFFTQHKDCVDAGLGVHVGIDNVMLTFQGTSDTWTEQELIFTYDPEYAATVDVNTHRWGGSDDYADDIHENNFMWVDAFSVEPLE